ncbi:MAG: hypothetical protein JRF17_08915 [Deltaproteobacteria bacterium]|jgi:pimeloyl-ACP methyl ester carboxylesterase|nr:hypothetical protein [Deltaproteobacteria bacterium]MBW2490575.1 hypothetical protein [Deltaproteobacteria bacterium]
MKHLIYNNEYSGFGYYLLYDGRELLNKIFSPFQRSYCHDRDIKNNEYHPGYGRRSTFRGFLAWRKWVRENPDLGAGRLLHLTCPHLSDQECAAYDAPFPDVRYKAGVRRFPEMVPDNPDADGAALSRSAREWLKTEWSGETFMAIGMRDPVLGPPVMKALGKMIANCPQPLEIAEAGHFVQEWGEEVARKSLEAFRP